MLNINYFPLPQQQHHTMNAVPTETTEPKMMAIGHVKRIRQEARMGHWSQKENAKYYAFLRKYQSKFNQAKLRRHCKIFKVLSKFIKTRNANQCRSHHHKMTKDFPSIQDAIDSVRNKGPSFELKMEKYFKHLKNISFELLPEYSPEQIESPPERMDQVSQQMVNAQEEEQPINLEAEELHKTKNNQIANMATSTLLEPINNYDLPPNSQYYGFPMMEMNPQLRLYYPFSTEEMRQSIEDAKRTKLAEANQLYIQWQEKLTQYNHLCQL